ncbi:MAG: insulinase family protein [Rhodospirillales bacterium]|nr:insulinase family protein [Rhodospirillales bacterium]
MEVQVTTLANGLRVVTDRMPNVETASVGAWVDVGTRDEKAEINGISHMLEHMAFKGTERRSAYDIAEEIEAVGGHLNAYTSRENTAYYAKILKQDLPLAVDMIADILQNSTMDPEELERERTVILQEIHQAHDTPDDIIFDYFQEVAYPDQAMGRPILGSVELVQSMQRGTILDYMRSNYSGSQMVFAAAGNLDHDHVTRLAEAAFAKLPKQTEVTRPLPTYSGGDFREERDLEQVHLMLGVNGVSYLDDDFYTASVLSTLFGGGMSSRLFQEIREKRGLAYSIYSFLSSYSDSGLFGIYAGTGAKEAAEILPLISAEMSKLADGIAADEIARARAQLKASILMSLESTSSRCEQMARQIAMYGRPMTVEETVERIDAVNESGLKKVAQQLLEGDVTLCAVGPCAHLGEKPKFS